MKKLFSLIIIGVSGLLLANESYGQVTGYLGDVSRYSQTTTGGGSARIRAMGGAQTALGGDISSAYLNPAGLGFYNRSEFSITPSFSSSGNDAAFFGENNYQYKNNLNISNLGFAFRGKNPNLSETGWLGGTFAISYQQLNNFSNSFSFQGSNPNNTFADSYLQYDDATLDGFLDDEDIGTTLAFNSFLIDNEFYYLNDNSDTVYYYGTYFPIPDSNYPTRQQGTVETSGSQGQWNFSYGGNFSDKLYLGAGIGISSISYRRNSNFSEEISPTLYEDFPDEINTYPNNRLLVEEEIFHEGGGINATLGVIARPKEYLTVGVSYRTPTFYAIEESYVARYNTFFLTSPSEEFSEGENYYNFNIRTPGVLNTGIAYFFQKNGILTADLEYIDYSNTKLTGEFNTLQSDNEVIPEIYNAVLNYRFGGEYRHENLRFRLGYAHQASPYTGLDSNDYSRNSYSAGIGLRLSTFYVDFALVQQRTNALYSPYTTDVERFINSNNETDFRDAINPEVNIKNRLTNAMLTIGLSF